MVKPYISSILYSKRIDRKQQKNAIKYTHTHTVALMFVFLSVLAALDNANTTTHFCFRHQHDI